MKKIILFLCLFCVYAYAMAQQIKNVEAKQEEQEIIINYELVADNDNQTFEVSIQLYEGEKPRYIPKNQNLRGDVGQGITRGQKQIIWAITEDIKTLKGNNFVFKVKARYTQNSSKPIPKEKPSEPTTTNNKTIYTETIKGVSFKMVYIQGGTFTIGSPASEPNRESDETQRQVSVNAFQMGETEVTQQLWEAVMGSNPSYFKDCPLCPVEQVSYEDIVNNFLPKLNKLTSKKYRLPTEEEWEYACRAGTITPFSTGDNLTTNQANYDGNYPYNNNAKGIYRQKTINIGSFPANVFGLFDMHGNVWEWTSTLYPNTSNRVLRGGSWGNDAKYCRSASRNGSTPANRYTGAGFRLSL